MTSSTTTLALFDLDNTLIAGDSDHLWGDWLVERGIVDGAGYKAANDQFYRDYQAGELDIHKYLEFSLGVLAEHSLEKLNHWRAQFVQEKIHPILLPKAQALVAAHRNKGHLPMIITATNDFVTAPIASALGIDLLLATQAEMQGNRYTGSILGIPCYQQGKVRRLQAWLDETGQSLAGSWFYSDSHNDLPLLEAVEHPVAVDPDALLAEVARARHWPVMSLRD